MLFNSAGMQQFSTVLSGEEDVIKKFGSRILTSCQKCFRSNDIQEVGDDTHNTFFEMLGNWSIGQNSQQGYFKEKAIEYALEFFCDVLKLSHLYNISGVDRLVDCIISAAVLEIADIHKQVVTPKQESIIDESQSAATIPIEKNSKVYHSISENS